MPTGLVRTRLAMATTASVALLGSSPVAQAAARTPSISGNGWVALGIIAALIAGIWFLIQGALHLERRDARLGRSKRQDDGWFGIFPANPQDEEDAPDWHHHGGDDGGESGN